MYLNFKHLLYSVIVTFLMVFNVGIASGSEESTGLLKFANHLYYNKSDATVSYPYYQQATDMGNVLAKAQVAKMLYLGAGVDKDKNLAQAWFKQVLPQLESAAQQGDPFAQYLYGYYWDTGLTGFKSASKAIYWYQQAAEHGSAPAQFNLASSYEDANEVAKDLGKAVYWYQLAADQGHLLSQVQLGEKYNNGEGVAKDPIKAVYWYRKAAEQGSAYAQYELGDKYYYGNGVQKSMGNAINWYTKAAYEGNVDAQKELGRIYYSGIINDNGNPTREDYHSAELWLKRAVANGSISAQGYLSALQEELEQNEIYTRNIDIVADIYNGDVDPDNWSYTTQNKYCSAVSKAFVSGLNMVTDGSYLSHAEKRAIKINAVDLLSLQKRYCE